MTDALSPLDSLFVVLEEADPCAHMHIGAALVFDSLPGGRVPTVDAVRERVLERLPLLPRFSQRLSSVHSKPFEWLTWEPAGPLDVEAHIRHARLPAPGRDRELLAWLSDFWSHRLDRRRPLWELVLVDGLPGRRWVLATKTHHCLVDGIGGLDIGTVLFDGVTAPPPAAVPRGRARRPGRFWLSPELLAQGAGALRHPVRTLVRGAAVTDMLAREELRPAPRTSINGEISGTRVYEVARFGLSDLKAIRAEAGGTVNDVILALSAGALRRLLLSRGEEPPERGLRAQVPVNIRTAADDHGAGNHLTSLYVDLPVAVPDPFERLRLIRERTEALKHSSQPLAGTALIDSAGASPPGIGALLGRAMYSDVRLFNLTVTQRARAARGAVGVGRPAARGAPVHRAVRRPRAGDRGLQLRRPGRVRRRRRPRRVPGRRRGRRRPPRGVRGAQPPSTCCLSSPARALTSWSRRTSTSGPRMTSPSIRPNSTSRL